PLSRPQRKEVDTFGKSPILPLRDFVGGIGAGLSGRRAAEPRAPPRGVLTPLSLAPQDGDHLHRGIVAAGGLDPSAPRCANQLMINRSLPTGRFRENAITKKSQSFRWLELGAGLP